MSKNRKKNAVCQDRAPRFLAIEKEPDHVIIDIGSDSEFLEVTAGQVKSLSVARADVGLDRIPDFERISLEDVQGASTDVVAEVVEPLRNVLQAPPGASLDDLLILRVVLLIAPFLRSRLPVRPIVVHTGPPDSGKTWDARLDGSVLIGPSFDVSTIAHRDRDFWVTAAEAPYLALDNVEKAPAWLPDALAQNATGGVSRARKLWSDSGVHRIRPDVFVALTSFSLPAWRGDVASRSLMFMHARPEHRMRETDAKRRINELRPAFYVQAVHVASRALAILDVRRAGEPESRLGDFELLGGAIAEAIGGRPGRNAFRRALRSMSNVRLSAAIENDPEVGALLVLAAENAGEEWRSAADLFKLVGKKLGASAMNTSGDRAAYWLREVKRRSAGLVEWQRERTRKFEGVRWKFRPIQSAKRGP